MSGPSNARSDTRAPAAVIFDRADTLVDAELHVFADAFTTVRAPAAREVPMAGDEIERGKPEPDIFPASAERLGAHLGLEHLEVEAIFRVSNSVHEGEQP
jgi:hypothetical protein